MLLPRLIPVLLIDSGNLVKTINFNKDRYLGDPLNAIRIFSEKEVDEIIILDISSDTNPINYSMLEKFASAARMPITYGGGIKDILMAQKIINLGFEKIAIRSLAIEDPDAIKTFSEFFGSSCITVVIDYSINRTNDSYSIQSNSRSVSIDPILFAQKMIDLGAGEIIFQSVEGDGSMLGYDIKFLTKLSESRITNRVPTVILGGASTYLDISQANKINSRVSFAAGSLFVYYGRLKALQLSYPSQQVKISLFTRG